MSFVEPVEALGAGESSPHSAVPGLLRELNERTVYDLLAQFGATSRAELSRRTGMSKPTVSLAVRNLELDGLVTEVGVESGRPGRSGVLYAANPTAGQAIAVDVGARWVRCAVCDLSGEHLTRAEARLTSRRTDRIIDAVVQVVDEATRAAGRPAESLRTAVVGSPGVVHPDTNRLTQVGVLESLEGVDLGARLCERLRVPVTVHNDVNLVAIAEQSAGFGRNIDDFAVVSVGSGLGAGLVLGGRLHRGHRGNAGEIDDVPFRHLGIAGPPIDPSGEGVVGLAWSRATAPDDSLALVAEAADVFALAADGDAGAMAVIDTLGHWVAWHVATLTAVLDLGLVVLAGGIGASPALLGPVREHLAALVPHPPQVESSALGGAAVVTGALALAREATIDRIFELRTGKVSAS